MADLKKQLEDAFNAYGNDRDWQKMRPDELAEIAVDLTSSKRDRIPSEVDRRSDEIQHERHAPDASASANDVVDTFPESEPGPMPGALAVLLDGYVTEPLRDVDPVALANECASLINGWREAVEGESDDGMLSNRSRGFRAGVRHCADTLERKLGEQIEAALPADPDDD